MPPSCVVAGRVPAAPRGKQPLPHAPRLLGRDRFWWLTKARILNKTVDSPQGRKLSTRDTLIGSSPGEMTKRHGVELEPRLVDAEGLYFFGLSWQHTRGSALIGWVGDDAEFVAGEIEAAGRKRVTEGA